MDEAVRLSIKGDKELRRKLRHFAKGRIRHRMTRKAVRAGLTPILKDARRRVPDFNPEEMYRSIITAVGHASERGSLHVYYTSRKKRKTEWRSTYNLPQLLRRSLQKRLKAWPSRGIVWGGVGPRTRVRVEVGRYRGTEGHMRPRMRSIGEIAMNLEMGRIYSWLVTPFERTKYIKEEIPPRPFMRPAFDSQRGAALTAMKRKLDLEIAKEAKHK